MGGSGSTAPLPSSPLVNNNNTFNERTFSGGLASAHSDTHKSVRLSLYQKPPTHKVSLDEFEHLAIARLHLLRLLDNCSLKSLKDDVTLSELDKMQSKHLPLHVNESALAFDVETERKNDLASHFILRLAMAESADNVRWFIQNEITLLK